MCQRMKKNVKVFSEINELNAMVTISMPERLNRTIPIKKRIRTIMRLDRFVKCKILGPKNLLSVEKQQCFDMKDKQP